MDPHRRSDLEVETDGATYTPRGYEQVYCFKNFASCLSIVLMPVILATQETEIQKIIV
jgi:hypothetical protein